MKVTQDLPKFLSQEEAARLLDTIEPNTELMEFNPRGGGNQPSEAKFLAIRDKAMLETIYSCGLRAQETANLNWRDIDFRAGFIRVNNGKGGKDRIVPIGEKALVALWDYGKAYHKRFEMEPAGLNPVFPSRRRQRHYQEHSTHDCASPKARRHRYQDEYARPETELCDSLHAERDEDKRAWRMPGTCEPKHDTEIYPYHDEGSD
jgi:site-specific recombinase XerD